MSAQGTVLPESIPITAYPMGWLAALPADRTAGGSDKAPTGRESDIPMSGNCRSGKSRSIRSRRPAG